jgi:hypothetical protein
MQRCLCCTGREADLEGRHGARQAPDRAACRGLGRSDLSFLRRRSQRQQAQAVDARLTAAAGASALTSRPPNAQPEIVEKWNQLLRRPLAFEPGDSIHTN